MPKVKKPKVFLDSSVWFAAVCSPTGGSSFILSLTPKRIEIITTATILAEVERNVRGKLEIYHLERFFNLVKKVQVLNQLPDKRLIKQAKKVIATKDATVLAEAKRIKPDFLITLDKKHFLKDKVKRFIKKTKICTPGEYIEKYLEREKEGSYLKDLQKTQGRWG